MDKVTVRQAIVAKMRKAGVDACAAVKVGTQMVYSQDNPILDTPLGDRPLQLLWWGCGQRVDSPVQCKEDSDGNC